MHWDDDDDYDNDNRYYDYGRSERERNRRDHEVNTNFNRHKSAINKLHKEVARLKMTTEALWELLKYHNGFTDEQLRQQVKSLDLKDGRTDGKVTKNAQMCPKCHRKSSARSSQCMYCGHAIGGESIF